LLAVQRYEEIIGERIGDPDFSYEDFDPKNYLVPMDQPAQ
jgi:hypothetical protein